MQVTQSYNPATLAQEAAFTAITTVETAVITVTDGKYPPKSQLTAYFDVTNIHDAVSIYIRYYFTPDFGVTWLPMLTRQTSNGELKDLPGFSLIDSTTYSPGSNMYTACDNVPMPATTGFKITLQASAGTTGAAGKVWSLVRDN